MCERLKTWDRQQISDPNEIQTASTPPFHQWASYHSAGRFPVSRPPSWSMKALNPRAVFVGFVAFAVPARSSHVSHRKKGYSGVLRSRTGLSYSAHCNWISRLPTYILSSIHDEHMYRRPSVARTYDKDFNVGVVSSALRSRCRRMLLSGRDDVVILTCSTMT